MGTEAQQALQKRTRALSPGGGARNVQGTRRAQQQALRKSAKPGHIAKRKPQREEQRGDPYGREIGDGQVGAGYGGMGHGPLVKNYDVHTDQGPQSDQPKEPDSAWKKAMDSANPSDLARQVLSKVGESSINYRPEGSIWDDPKYSQMANERGPTFAMKARNFDRKYNMAKQMAQTRREAQEDQLAMDEGKLRDQQLQHAMRQYGPQGTQATGIDPATGLATDSSGAFTGEGHQARMTGPGPASEAQVEQQQAQVRQQHEIRQKGIEALSDRLSAEYDKYEPNEKKIEAMERRLDQLLGLQEPQGGQPAPTGGEETPPVEGARKAPDGNWYVQKNGQWYEVDQEGQTPESPRTAQDVKQRLMEANPGADPNSEEFQNLYTKALQRFGLADKQSVTGPDGTEYKVGDRLPNGTILKGVNADGTVDVDPAPSTKGSGQATGSEVAPDGGEERASRKSGNTQQSGPLTKDELRSHIQQSAMQGGTGSGLAKWKAEQEKKQDEELMKEVRSFSKDSEGVFRPQMEWAVENYKRLERLASEGRIGSVEQAYINKIIDAINKTVPQDRRLSSIGA